MYRRVSLVFLSKIPDGRPVSLVPSISLRVRTQGTSQCHCPRDKTRHLAAPKRTSKDICAASRNSQKGHKHRHLCCARGFAYSHIIEVGVHVEDPRRQGRQLIIVHETPARSLQTVTLSLLCTRPLQDHCRQSRYHYCARDPCKIIADSHVIIIVHETPARLLQTVYHHYCRQSRYQRRREQHSITTNLAEGLVCCVVAPGRLAYSQCAEVHELVEDPRR